MKHAEEPLDEGTAIFCMEMFGNGVVQRVSGMKGSYILLETEFLNCSQPWTGLKYHTIIASSCMIHLTCGQKFWLLLSILRWLLIIQTPHKPWNTPRTSIM
jgi:hypothetical protein